MFLGLQVALFACCCGYSLGVNQKRLYITTIDAPPYVTQEGGEFKGMLVELMKELWDVDMDADSDIKKDISGYEYHFVKDGNYGAKVNNRWTGMIGELFHGKADLAIAPLTVTEDRKEAIDFSTPWLPIHLTVLIEKEYEIWTLDQLINQSKVKYGCVGSGSTAEKFRTETNSPYKEMWTAIEDDQTNLVSTNKDGRDKVLNSNYAFIIESPTAEYMISSDYPKCRLATFGRFMHSQGYAFAFPKNSQYKDDITDALNKALFHGKVDRLYQKWIVQGGKCRHYSAAASLTAGPVILASFLLFHFLL